MQIYKALKYLLACILVGAILVVALVAMFYLTSKEILVIIGGGKVIRLGTAKNTISSNTGRYEAQIVRATVGTETVVIRDKYAKTTSMVHIPGVVDYILWSPNDNIVAIQSFYRRVKIFNTKTNKEIPLDINCPQEGVMDSAPFDPFYHRLPSNSPGLRDRICIGVYPCRINWGQNFCVDERGNIEEAGYYMPD